MKRPFMVWIGFISICCSKGAKEGKSCPRLLVLQRVAQNNKSCSKVAEHNLFMPKGKGLCNHSTLYNNPGYSHILIGSCLWSIRGQTYDWRHHYRVFASAVLKWRKVLRIRIIFYLTGQKIRYKKVLPRHWTGLRSQKTKDKAVSFKKWYRNNFLAASVGSRA